MLGGFGAVAHGTFPEMIDEGITVGLGTDAGAVSRFLDLVRVSYLSACAHKDARVDAEVMGAEAAFEMATTAGATAALWDDEIGSIEVGKKADIVVFSTDAPEWHPNPLHNPVANLVYSASGKSARDVIIDGRLVMENRQFNELDVNDYYRRACKTASGIYDRLGVSVGPKSWPIR
jgi:cytosine/adenosine deaminase-related metal-dependent hydrolase